MQAPKSEFTLCGRLGKFTRNFFDEDPPIVGEGPSSRVCWPTTFKDETGSTNIRVWDSAFFDLTNVSAIKLRSLWEDGFDNEGKRESILETLNGKIDKKVRLACTSSIWAYGGTVKKYKAEINVDAAYTVDG